MVTRVRYMSMLCVGSLIVTMVQANKMENSASVSVHGVSVDATKSNTIGSFGAIDQDFMNIVIQVMYGKTPGQVIDELVYAYGDGEQTTISLAAIAQRLSQQLGYLNIAIESAQAIIAVLPPTSPHLVAAKLMINELSVFATCAQTVSAQIQQNAQATAPAAAPSTPTAVAAAAPAASAPPASGSDAALASAAVSFLGDVASAVAASSNATSASQTTTSSTTAPTADSNTHHHEHGW